MSWMHFGLVKELYRARIVVPVSPGVINSRIAPLLSEDEESPELLQSMFWNRLWFTYRKEQVVWLIKNIEKNRQFG